MGYKQRAARIEQMFHAMILENLPKMKGEIYRHINMMPFRNRVVFALRVIFKKLPTSFSS